jgi:hypothetical protein
MPLASLINQELEMVLRHGPVLDVSFNQHHPADRRLEDRDHPVGSVVDCVVDFYVVVEGRGGCRGRRIG